LPYVKDGFLILIVLLAIFPGIVLAREAREQQRIDFLLHSVETAREIVFIRNGSEYDGTAAGKHLRDKLAYAGERVKTAEQFIQYCASESSMTHRKYTVRLADGRTVDSAVYFGGLLREWEQRAGR
jgi:3-mercaptopyruvate sulfurtransferase SseA